MNVAPRVPLSVGFLLVPVGREEGNRKTVKNLFGPHRVRPASAEEAEPVPDRRLLSEAGSRAAPKVSQGPLWKRPVVLLLASGPTVRDFLIGLHTLKYKLIDRDGLLVPVAG